MRHRAALVAGSLGLALVGQIPEAAGQGPAPAEWRAFEGSWSVSGRRSTVPIEGGTLAAVVEVSGAVVLTSGEGLSRGFRGEAIGFDDGQGVTDGVVCVAGGRVAEGEQSLPGRRLRRCRGQRGDHREEEQQP